jgi:hypothetical protein
MYASILDHAYDWVTSTYFDGMSIYTFDFEATESGFQILVDLTNDHVSRYFDKWHVNVYSADNNQDVKKLRAALNSAFLHRRYWDCTNVRFQRVDDDLTITFDIAPLPYENRMEYLTYDGRRTTGIHGTLDDALSSIPVGTFSLTREMGYPLQWSVDSWEKDPATREYIEKKYVISVSAHPYLKLIFDNDAVLSSVRIGEGYEDIARISLYDIQPVVDVERGYDNNSRVFATYLPDYGGGMGEREEQRIDVQSYSDRIEVHIDTHHIKQIMNTSTQ